MAEDTEEMTICAVKRFNATYVQIAAATVYSPIISPKRHEDQKLKKETVKRKNTSAIALGGICLALTLIFIFAGSIIPGIELTLFAISSLFVAVMIIESGVSAGAILYAAAVILGLVLVPNKLAMIPYAFFFGYYGIVKFFIEKLKNGIIQIVIKAVFFAFLLCISLLGFKELLLGSIRLPDCPTVILIIAGILIMLVYDYIYTLLINFYLKRIKNRGADNMKLS